MKFILLIVLSANGGSGMNMWKQPAITTAAFADGPACAAALRTFETLVKASKLEYTSVSAACVPAGGEAK